MGMGRRRLYAKGGDGDQRQRTNTPHSLVSFQQPFCMPMSSTTVADSTSLPSASPGTPPTKQEALKAGSGHLHDPLAAELGNPLPSFTDPAVQILKFHGSYQQDDRDKRRKGVEKDWQMMLRLRNPGGRIPTSLYLALDALADRLGNGTLRITTRQAFQMHGVQKTDLKEVIGGIVRALGSTL